MRHGVAAVLAICVVVPLAGCGVGKPSTALSKVAQVSGDAGVEPDRPVDAPAPAQEAVDADALGTATTCPPHTTAKRRAHTYGVPQRTGHEEWCETAAGVKHGYWRKTWQGGLLKEQGTYRNGKLDGAWTEWFDNGQESREGGYRNGNRHGVWRGWWGSRKLADERYYEDGVAVGIWTEWYPSGEVMTRGGWLDGEQHGEDIAYEVNGVVARVLVFDRGKLVKAELYENGVVVKSATGTRDEPVDLEALEGVVE